MLEAKRGARVYAFEPNPDCYRRLLKNVVENRLQDRIQTFNVALGEHVASGTMRVEGGGTTGGTVVLGDSMTTDEGAHVTVTTVDHMVSALGIPRIDLLKIDVEGAEIDVLQGAARSLPMTRRMIIEYHSRSLLAQVERLAAKHGFILDQKVEYYPQNADAGQDEVGIVYFKRREEELEHPPVAPAESRTLAGDAAE
jgi:FkbM family methyltransferase